MVEPQACERAARDGAFRFEGTGRGDAYANTAPQPTTQSTGTGLLRMPGTHETWTFFFPGTQRKFIEKTQEKVYIEKVLSNTLIEPSATQQVPHSPASRSVPMRTHNQLVAHPTINSRPPQTLSCTGRIPDPIALRTHPNSQGSATRDSRQAYQVGYITHPTAQLTSYRSAPLGFDLAEPSSPPRQRTTEVRP